MGSDAIALPAVRFLQEQKAVCEVVGVFSQPDRPSGRGKHLHANPVAAWALENDITLLRPERLSAGEVAWLREAAVDLIVVMAYGHILKPDLLAVPPLGVVNLHSSLLPKYRGASPIVGAIASGEEATGVTLMEIVPEMDAGAIIDQEIVPIKPAETAIEITEKIADACIPLLERTLSALLSVKYSKTEQDKTQASYTRKLKKEDGQLDFGLTAEELVNRHRALQPWPGSFFEYDNIVLKVGDCATDTLAEQPAECGTILEASEKGIAIQTASGAILIKKIQRPGGKMLSASDFLRGFHLETGIALNYKPSTPLVSQEPFPRKKKNP